MNKREFVTRTAAAAMLPAGAALAANTTNAGPMLLTVSGDISRTNRGPFDAALVTTQPDFRQSNWIHPKLG